MIKLIDDYEAARQAIYDHVGFKPDWVVCSLDDATAYFWRIDGEKVKFAKSEEELRIETGNYYEDELYTQRHYPKWVYWGAEFSMVMCDPHTDGVKWFRLFDNEKERPLL